MKIYTYFNFQSIKTMKIWHFLNDDEYLYKECSQSCTVYLENLRIEDDELDDTTFSVDEGHFRQIFERLLILNSHDEVKVKSKIRSNSRPYNYALIRFSSKEAAVEVIDNHHYAKTEEVPIYLIIVDEETKIIFRSNQNSCFVWNPNISKDSEK